MLIIAIVATILSLICGVILIFFLKAEFSDWPVFATLGWVTFGLVATASILIATKLNLSSQQLTGYIYSATTTWGYTTGHIRFSEQAGTDAQPEFCVSADSEAGKKIRELAGSSRKVKVTIPPYFYFDNNPFACGTTETAIEVVE